jgi:hypothetical protein
MPQKPVSTTLFVSQIIAGSDITISPPSGTGIVTVNATGSVYNPANVTITGGTIDGTTIGGTTPEPGTFTTLNATSLGATTPGSVFTNALHVDTGTKTASATAGAATLNKMSGVITSEALTTAAGADYTLTLSNTDIAAADVVLASCGNGTNTQGDLLLGEVQVSANQVIIKVRNGHATQAFNGTITIAFVVFKN